MKFANQAGLLAFSMVLSSAVFAQVPSRPAACDKLNECTDNFDNNSCQAAQPFFDFAATQPTAQCGPYLAAQEALFACFVASTCEVLNGPEACSAETTAVEAFPGNVALFCLQNGPLPVAPPTPPAAWTCEAAFFGSDDGCDCGCGAADPDCATTALGSCRFNNCVEIAPELDPANATACVAADCGNSSVGPDEQCDGGADCGPECTLPDGSLLTCDFAGACHTLEECGDGFVDVNLFGGEECDDSNVAANDGCSATCTIEIGFKCEDAPSVCTPTTCGDSVVEGTETCDDANAVATDGCSATCQTEEDYACVIAGRPCRAFVCGDNNTEGTEDCDDGNAAAGDGCTATCTLEPNFACVDDDLPCVATVCGDDVVDANEDCDDGNTTDGDGCSATCTTEPPPDGWNCNVTFYGTGDGCDCGCGVADPDCASDALAGVGCDDASCNADGCAFCYDAAGEDIGQAAAQDSNDGCVGLGGEGEGEGEGEGDNDGEGEAGGEGEGEGGGGCSSAQVDDTDAPAFALLMGAATLMIARRRRSA